MNLGQLMKHVPWGEMEKVMGSRGPLIRHRVTGLCPICQVANDRDLVSPSSGYPLESLNDFGYIIGRTKLGLSEEEVNTIMMTSDFVTVSESYCKKLRATMEKRMIREERRRINDR